MWRRIVATIVVSAASTASAQQRPVAADLGQDQTPVPASTSSPAPPTNRWSLAFDGVVFGTFDRQGGLRGDTEFVSQNWLMGMGTRRIGRGTLTLTAMLSRNR